jgi:hypothetical protein
MPIPANSAYLDNESYYLNENDYINASIIKGSLDYKYKYIAAQGPTKDTILDFITMLVQFNTKIVICACNEYEGKKVFKENVAKIIELKFFSFIFYLELLLFFFFGFFLPTFYSSYIHHTLFNNKNKNKNKSSNVIDIGLTSSTINLNFTKTSMSRSSHKREYAKAV